MKADTFQPFLFPSSFILVASFLQKIFCWQGIFNPDDKGKKTIAFLLKERTAIPAKHVCFESVIGEGSTNGVEIFYLLMICIWKVIEVEQEKGEPGPNSIRLSKDKPFYFLLPRAQGSHSSGKVEGVFVMSRQGECNRLTVTPRQGSTHMAQDFR